MLDTENPDTTVAIEEAAQAVELEETEDESDSSEAEESDDDGAQLEEAPVESEPAPPRRGDKRIQALSERARAAEERAIRAEALAEERARLQSMQPQNLQAMREREERLALMDPVERKLFEQEERLAKLHQEIQISQVRSQDQADKSEYLAKAATNPIYAKHADKVESILAEMRKNGSNAPRESVLSYVIGQEFLKGPSAKQVTAAKNAAATRVKASQSAPVSGRGDANTRASAKDDSLEAITRRLKNFRL